MAKTDPPILLAQIASHRECIREAERAQEACVQLLRVEGVSWTVIAEAMGVSRQAARQRFAPRQLL